MAILVFMETMTRFANGWVVLGMVASGKWNPKKADHRTLIHWFLA